MEMIKDKIIISTTTGITMFLEEIASRTHLVIEDVVNNLRNFFNIISKL